MPLLARLAVRISEFANARGVYMGRRATKVHVALYRWSGGRLGGHFPAWPAAPILLLEHTGARTGTRRTSPLMYHEDNGIIAVVASKGGQPTHPAWFHNLRAHPEAAIQIRAHRQFVRARVATEDERDGLWPKFVAFYPGYDFFERIAEGRKIPIVILEPEPPALRGR